MADLFRTTLLAPRPARRAPAAAGGDPLLRRLAAGAATLDERLAGGYEPVPGADPAIAGERLREWRARLAAAAGGGAFARRLRWDGWTLTAARAALGPVRLRDDAPLPAWAAVAGDLLRHLRGAADEPGGQGTGDRGQGTAGEPQSPPGAGGDVDALLLPLVAAARERLRAERLPGARLSAAAWADLEGWLLRSLSADFAEALAVERAAFQALRRPGDPASAAARGFVRRMRAGGMESLLVRSPVLARMAAARVAHWVDAAGEMIRRLAADRAELCRAFGGGRPLGEVTAVGAGLSDPHRGGRAVMVLTFAPGVRVVYKPRPLAADAAWRRLLAWIAEDGGPRLRAPRVAPRGGYGWAEHVAPRPRRTPAQAERFHERAGMLLCLAWLLGGSDHHADNLVERGAHPVLVDLEVMFGTPLEPGDGDDGSLAGAYATWGSVLRTHLLPQWRPGDPAEARTPLPFAEMHRGALLAGFARMYRLLLRRRGELFDAAGPLAAFAACPVRAVLRHTRVYARLLARLRHPRFLADGAARSLEIEALCGPLLRAEEPAAGWAACRAERRDLEQGDVPVFTARAASLVLHGSRGEPAPGLRRVTGFAAATRRLREMDEDGLALHLDVVRVALRPHAAPGEAAHALGCGGALSRGAALAEAVAIADRLAAAALPCGGGVRWLAVVPSPDPRAARLGYTDASTGDGVAGIARFLAACARASGSAAGAGLARRSGRRGVERGEAAPARPAAARGDDLGGGRFGEVDALIRAGRHDEARALAAEALRRARRRGSFALGGDDAFAPGLMHGVAGIGYTLLRLHAPERHPPVRA